MKTLTQALAECGLVGAQRFRNYCTFLLPSETAFESGHFGDWDHVRTEEVKGDNGGRTRYGIDQRSHPTVDVGGLTMGAALQIYLNGDWNLVAAAYMPPGYGEILCDIHVNGGNGGLMVQQALNGLGAAPPLVEDGHVGPKTKAAMLIYGRPGLKAFLARRDAYFHYLAEHHADDRQFLTGWLNRDAALADWLEHNQNLRLHLGLPLALTALTALTAS
ncbi:MAG: hypothetical protein JWO94_1269 [Verrucomicrobiaceae bacterium]|nr:hypothetical protein [Verrucomicrobiaceae bacterium]